jgi:hypothetical protein
VGLAAGAAAGSVFAAVCSGDGDTAECLAAVPLLGGLAGAGAAAVGALIDRADRRRHVVWTPKSIRVTPLVGKTRAGVGVMVRW